MATTDAKGLDRIREFGKRIACTNFPTGEEGYEQAAQIIAEFTAQEIAAERLECAKAVCRFCAFGSKPTQQGAYWHHVLPEGIGSCYAADIWGRNRNEKESASE